MKNKYITKKSKDTQKVGKLLAKSILSQKKFLSDMVIIELFGDLGGGKTTFLQGFAKGLGVKEKILSPTFVIIKNFKFMFASRYIGFHHIDCYRIRKSKDIVSLGLKDRFFSPGNIIAIEWPERITKILPKNTIKMRFIFVDKNTRKITIEF